MEPAPAPSDPVLLARRLARAQRARIEAERLLEEKSLALHLANEQLSQLNTDLESRVAERTAQLEVAHATAVKASAAKSEFFARISHEIRTPLNGVIGATALLRDQISDPGHASLLDTISSSAELLLSLVNDVLDFSRIEAGRLELNVAPFDLAEAVNRTKNLFQSAAESKGLYFRIDCRLPGPCLVMGDALRLQQVFVNLIGNAIKFTETGGVHFLAEPITAESGQIRRYRFVISDTGPGLDDAQQKLLFQPFAQAGTDPHDRIRGSGLGLVTCERLVGLAGGSLRLSSELGRGTELRFTLPLPAAAPAEAVQKSKQLRIPDHSRRLRVVVVDDVKNNVDILTMVLKRMGHDVSGFSSGAEAFAFFEQHSADLAIIDLQMPEMDGFALVKKLRSAAGVADALPPLIAFTADARVETVKRCLAGGFDECLHKPIRPASLAITIDRLIPPSKS